MSKVVYVSPGRMKRPSLLPHSVQHDSCTHVVVMCMLHMFGVVGYVWLGLF